MNNKQKKSFELKPVANYFISVGLITLLFGCNKQGGDKHDLKNFSQVNLVANSSRYRPVTVDTTLLNAFGLAWSPIGTAWVNSVGGHVSELYSGEGAIVRTPVNIPSPGNLTGGLPTGIVFSAGAGFNLSNGASSFLFAGFDGVLSGWNPASGNNAKQVGGFAGAAYTGLAIASDHGRNLVYAANFSGRRIDVWDTAFRLIPMHFADAGIPLDYSPYNIQTVGDKLFVMYGQQAKTGEGGHVAGPGKGYVSIFNTDGSFFKRFASGGSLNLPWGATMSPSGFLSENDRDTEVEGAGSKTAKQNPNEPVILIGNFGDGHINVYSLDSKFLGQLRSHDHTIIIDGLWALSFAPATATSINPNRLYFTAGPANEADGLFGYLIKQ